jgi:hypothetical protein
VARLLAYLTGLVNQRFDANTSHRDPCTRPQQRTSMKRQDLAERDFEVRSLEQFQHFQ